MIAPTYATTEWDTIVLAGVRSPGTVTLSGHVRSVGWDVKEASGQDGATTTRKGEPVGKFTATFHLVADVDHSDFDEWPAFQELIESSTSGAKPVALAVDHPDLQRNRFGAVVLDTMGEMVPDGKGGATIAVGFLEYRPPKPKPPVSAAKQSPEAETEGDTRIREAQAELDALLEEGKSL